MHLSHFSYITLLHVCWRVFLQLGPRVKHRRGFATPGAPSDSIAMKLSVLGAKAVANTSYIFVIVL